MVGPTAPRTTHTKPNRKLSFRYYPAIRFRNRLLCARVRVCSSVSIYRFNIGIARVEGEEEEGAAKNGALEDQAPLSYFLPVRPNDRNNLFRRSFYVFVDKRIRKIRLLSKSSKSSKVYRVGGEMGIPYISR